MGITCRFKSIIVGCAVMLMVTCTSAFPAKGKYSGTVVNIIDGDSLVVEHRGVKEIIRLYGIDSPEWDQPFASLAKEYLENQILYRNVVVHHLYEDSYQRSIALLSFQNLNLSEELVAKGYAWVHRYYCKKKICSEWLKLENQARESKRGLWLEETPIPPWRWKHR